MSYDALAESLALLAGAPPAGHVRLSRRVRHLRLAVDRDGDVAATMVLRRGVSGVPEIDVHTLELIDDVWRLLGGGSAPADEVTEERPRRDDLGSPAVSQAHGGTARSAGRAFGGGSWISWAQLRAAREVAALRVNTRLVPVAAHGCAIVVWTRVPPAVVALDASGAALGSVDRDRLSGRRRLWRPGEASP